MRVAHDYRIKGAWPEHECVATATLDYDRRYRRRMKLTDDTGAPFLLDLARAHILQDGDAVALEAGGFIRIQAAPEPVMDVIARSPTHLAKLAWHLGNRHTATQITGHQSLRIRADAVLADMLAGLGAQVIARHAPFCPEQGAYFVKDAKRDH